MSPSRRDFFAILAGGAASLAGSPVVSSAVDARSSAPAPVSPMRQRGLITTFDLDTQKGSKVVFRVDIAANRIDVDLRSSVQSVSLHRFSSTNSEIVKFIADVFEAVSDITPDCPICHDRGEYVRPFTFELCPCPACG